MSLVACSTAAEDRRVWRTMTASSDVPREAANGWSDRQCICDGRLSERTFIGAVVLVFDRTFLSNITQ